MKKELKQRAEAYAASTSERYTYAVTFSRIAPDARYQKEKYFFKYAITHTVAEAFTTQKELDEFLKAKGF